MKKEKIINQKLIDFLNDFDKAYFAKIAYECGAVDLVKSSLEFNHYTGEMRNTYKFYESILIDSKNENIPYRFFVLHLEKVSFILYEISYDKIIPWVCYTEETKRNLGFMTNLLKELKLLYPKLPIIMDTFDKTLSNICKKQKIKLFRD